MEAYQAWILSVLILFLIEMATPALFFASLALGCFIASIAAYFGLNITHQFVLFAIISILSIALIRPLLLSKRNGKTKTGVEEKYIGKEAKSITKITKDSGRIKIYGEEWEAKTISDEDIEVGENVKIIKNESLIMYVSRWEES